MCGSPITTAVRRAARATENASALTSMEAPDADGLKKTWCYNINISSYSLRRTSRGRREECFQAWRYWGEFKGSVYTG